MQQRKLRSMIVASIFLGAMFFVTLTFMTGGYANTLDECNTSRSADARIEACTQVIEKGGLDDANLSYAYSSRGVAYDYKDDYAKALADYDQAIRLKPDEPAVYNNRGAAHTSIGNHIEAIADFTQAIALDPAYMKAYTNRGRGYFHLGNFPAAVPDFEKAASLAPNEPYAALWHVLAMGRNGASRWRNQARTHNDHVDVDTWPGPFFQFFVGRANEEELLAAAKNGGGEEAKGRECEAYYYLGEYWLIEGDFKKARTYFERTVATNVTSFLEYTGAQKELAHLGAP